MQHRAAATRARRPSRPGRSGATGQAVVEASLILPLLLLVVLIGIDFGRLYAYQVTVNDSSRQAARYAAANPADQFTSSACGGNWNGTVSTAQQEASGSPVTIGCGNVAVSEAGPDSYGSKYITATVTAPFTFATPFLTPLIHLDHVTASDTAREFNNCTAASPTYSAEAWTAAISSVSVATIPGLLVAQADARASAGDTGAIPASGGTATSGPLSFSIPNVLTGSLLSDTATGGGCSAAASSRVASVAILPGLLPGNTDLVDLGTLVSSTSRVCGSAANQSGYVLHISIEGHQVSIIDQNTQINNPNYTITVPGSLVSLTGTAATITFNHQNPSSNPPATDAVSINFPAGGALSPYIVGTVTVAHAQANCT